MNHSSHHRLNATAILAAIATLSACIGPLPMAQACPMCAESLNDGPAEAQPDAAIVSGSGQDRGGVARGYFWSILFMLSMPFLLVAAMVTMLVVTRRRPELAGKQ